MPRDGITIITIIIIMVNLYNYPKNLDHIVFFFVFQFKFKFNFCILAYVLRVVSSIGRIYLPRAAILKVVASSTELINDDRERERERGQSKRNRDMCREIITP